MASGKLAGWPIKDASAGVLKIEGAAAIVAASANSRNGFSNRASRSCDVFPGPAKTSHTEPGHSSFPERLKLERLTGCAPPTRTSAARLAGPPTLP